MSLLDKASLIVTPNGYSEDTLYSVVPSSGAGDLSFTRATDAWRTNSEGLVQRVAWNLFTFSEDFSNISWGKNNVTITSNVILSPSNTLTGDLYTSLIAGSFLIINGLNFVVQPYTFSVYVKKYSAPSVSFDVQYHLSGLNNTVFSFNFDTGVATGCIAQDAGNGWWRLAATTTLTAARSQIRILSNDTFYIWGAQVNEGSSALEYFPTTDRRNVPRIDYSLGGCPTLLMEPQRTNISTGSENMAGSWNVNGATLTANSEISPSGLLNASKITIASATNGYIFKDIAGTIVSTVYTFSVYIKSATGANVNGGIYAINSANSTSFTATNTWQRVSVTGTASATTSSFYIGGFGSLSLGEDIYVWGAQVEAGDSATSYIPTATASVTRNADAAIKAGISSLLGQTEGTVFYEISIPKITGLGNQVFSNISNDAASFFCNAFVNSTGNIVFDIYAASGIYTFTLTTSAPAVVGRNRVALVYKAGAYKVFLNGVLVATSTNSTPITNTISRLALSSGKSTIYHYEFVAFKSALSNAELAILTTK